MLSTWLSTRKSPIATLALPLVGVLLALPADAQPTPRGALLIEQDTPGMPDVSEPDDRFGAAVAVGDFDGDGDHDLAIAASHQDIGQIEDAGTVTVIYHDGSALDPSDHQVWEQGMNGLLDLAEHQDRFGSALAVGDFDGNGADDLVIGVADEDVDFNGSTWNNAGAVHVIYGQLDLGLRSDGNQLFYQGEDVKGFPEDGDRFGRALAVGDFDGDGRDDLAIGVPFEDVVFGLDEITNAGAVQVIYGSPSGLNASTDAEIEDQIFDQHDLGDTVEINDRFGLTLATGRFDDQPDSADALVVGTPYEHLPAASDAGMLHVIPGRNETGLDDDLATSLSQNDFFEGLSESNDRFGDGLAAGDFDGDGTDDLAIGVSGEDGQGQVDIVRGHPVHGLASAAAAGSLDRAQMDDEVGINDRFGEHLTSADFDGDGRDDLVIAVPRATVDGVADAGIAYVLGGRANATLGPVFVVQPGAPGPGALEVEAGFGASLAVGDLDGNGFFDLVIGTPLDDAGAGTQDAGNVIWFPSGTLFGDSFESGSTAAWSQSVP